MTAPAWRNRIVGYGTEAPDQLVANPANWRIHPQTQTDALGGVLREVGIVQNVIVNQTTGFVVDGHARIMLALRSGQPTIPVTYVELTEAEEALILATLDPISAMAGADSAALGQLLDAIETDDDAVRALLEQVAQDVGLPALDAPPPGGGGDEFDASADDGPTRAQLGDLWVIGGVHRLIVGDSTDPATVARLLGGEQVDCVFTSPPYDQQRTYEGKMASDWRALLAGVCAAMLPHLEDDAQVFVNLGLVHRDGRVVRYWDGLIADLDAAAWPLFGWYVWDKLNGMPGDWNGRLAPAHEWVFHFCRESLKPNKTVKTKREGDRVGSTQRNPDGSLKSFTRAGAAIQPYKIPDSVVRLSPMMERGSSVGDHPAVFPIALPETFMQAYAGGLWYEPFCGSGTSIIAAHRTGRRCYGVELNPRYADIVLRRAEAEGLTVARVDPAT